MSREILFRLPVVHRDKEGRGSVASIDGADAASNVGGWSPVTFFVALDQGVRGRQARHDLCPSRTHAPGSVTGFGGIEGPLDRRPRRGARSSKVSTPSTPVRRRPPRQPAPHLRPPATLSYASTDADSRRVGTLWRPDNASSRALGRLAARYAAGCGQTLASFVGVTASTASRNALPRSI